MDKATMATDLGLYRRIRRSRTMMRELSELSAKLGKMEEQLHSYMHHSEARRAVHSLYESKKAAINHAEQIRRYVEECERSAKAR